MVLGFYPSGVKGSRAEELVTRRMGDLKLILLPMRVFESRD